MLDFQSGQQQGGGVGQDDPRLNRLRSVNPPAGNRNLTQQQSTGQYVQGLLGQFGLSPQAVKGMTWQQIQSLVGQRGGAGQAQGYQSQAVGTGSPSPFDQEAQQAQQAGQTPEQYFAGLDAPRQPQQVGGFSQR